MLVHVCGVPQAAAGQSKTAAVTLPGLASNQPEVQVVEERRSFVAHGDPVLID